MRQKRIFSIESKASTVINDLTRLFMELGYYQIESDIVQASLKEILFQRKLFGIIPFNKYILIQVTEQSEGSGLVIYDLSFIDISLEVVAKTRRKINDLRWRPDASEIKQINLITAR